MVPSSSKDQQCSAGVIPGYHQFFPFPQQYRDPVHSTATFHSLPPHSHRCGQTLSLSKAKCHEGLFMCPCLKSHTPLPASGWGTFAKPKLGHDPAASLPATTAGLLKGLKIRPTQKQSQRTPPEDADLEPSPQASSKAMIILYISQLLNYSASSPRMFK